ncbi:MAG: hypothetical protein ACRDLB_09990 [Actinomycetota bacterium]
MLDEGWYLMSVEELERELIRWRAEEDGPVTAERLTIEDALAFRDAGNIPDGAGRSLRLVLHVASRSDLAALDEKRRRWEPDYLEAPTWRREGSKPVNVVPLRPAVVEGWARAWWEDEEVGPLEEEWQRAGTVAGLRVPAEVRGFVFKTVVELQGFGKDVTVESVVGSLARWLEPADVAKVAAALREANA